MQQGFAGGLGVDQHAGAPVTHQKQVPPFGQAHLDGLGDLPCAGGHMHGAALFGQRVERLLQAARLGDIYPSVHSDHFPLRFVTADLMH